MEEFLIPKRLTFTRYQIVQIYMAFSGISNCLEEVNK